MSKEHAYVGLLAIGDPHLASRVPGFRKDDYPRVILEKLRWALAYARRERLLPLVLGDWFHWPRDNANWLIVELLRMFSELPEPLLGVVGNHDCTAARVLTPDDSLAVLEAAGVVRLLSQESTWLGEIAGRTVLIGATSWEQPLPTDAPFPLTSRPPQQVVWLTHHDLRFPDQEEVGQLELYDWPGVDLVINGHQHRPVPPVTVGRTTWINPGNLTRIKRSDATRARAPLVTRIEPKGSTFQATSITVPHQPFDAVFFEAVAPSTLAVGPSLFVQGLEELQRRRTASGAGFAAFLEQNLKDVPPAVAAIIREISEEVIDAHAK